MVDDPVAVDDVGLLLLQNAPGVAHIGGGQIGSPKRGSREFLELLGEALLGGGH